MIPANFLPATRRRVSQNTRTGTTLLKENQMSCLNDCITYVIFAYYTSQEHPGYSWANPC